jgi:hypothetical protein
VTNPSASFPTNRANPLVSMCFPLVSAGIPAGSVGPWAR